MNSLSITGLEREAASDDRKTEVRQPLSFWKMALAVFVGNILTALLAAFIYSLHIGW